MMECYNPILAYKCNEGEKMKIVGPARKYSKNLDKKELNEITGEIIKPYLLPCGKCTACRIKYASQWADRCKLEADKWESNFFATITYDEQHLPYSEKTNYMTLRPQDMTLFIKRLRGRAETSPIRYFYCGEYGSKSMRPHYHAIFFNLKITDLKQYNPHTQGYKLYTSAWLNDIWGKGDIKLGTVNYNSANYTAKYITKKNKDIDYEKLDIYPEYARMSRKPGIASDIIMEKGISILKGDDIYTKGGHKLQINKYYQKKLEELGKEEKKIVLLNKADKSEIQERKIEARKDFKNFNTLERLKEAEEETKKTNIRRK